MEVAIDKHRQQNIECLRNLSKKKFVKICPNSDDEDNEYLPLAILLDREEGEEEQMIGGDHSSRYEFQRIQFQFNVKNGLWKMNPLQSNGEELNGVFDDIQFVAFNRRVQDIIQRDERDSCFSSASDQVKNENKVSTTILEDDQIQKETVDFNSAQKFLGSPPPVVPRRSRQNSACSTQSGVRYASFIPPSTAAVPVRQRRVIESVLLYVQRKKNPFEKIVDLFRGIERPSMYDLGLEFLRVYDGRFNYREGHTFNMSFRKKSWLLTIGQIKCIDCPAGENGPRSMLILHYKGRYANVHV